VDSCGAIGDASGDCLLGCLDGRCLGCTPDCTGKPCGDDGCGGSCGACADGERCFDPPGGTAVCRVGRGLDCCGDRLCKKVVDPFTRKPWTSLYDPCAQGCWKGWCLGCTWDCFDRSCGDDGCGGSCGTCPSPTTCSVAGRCGT
jgi:hypothetical protein